MKLPVSKSSVLPLSGTLPPVPPPAVLALTNVIGAPDPSILMAVHSEGSDPVNSWWAEVLQLLNPAEVRPELIGKLAYAGGMSTVLLEPVLVPTPVNIEYSNSVERNRPPKPVPDPAQLIASIRNPAGPSKLAGPG